MAFSGMRLKNGRSREVGGELPVVALVIPVSHSDLEIVFKQGWIWAIKKNRYLSRCKKPPFSCQKYIFHLAH